MLADGEVLRLVVDADLEALVRVGYGGQRGATEGGGEDGAADPGAIVAVLLDGVRAALCIARLAGEGMRVQAVHLGGTRGCGPLARQ